MRKFKLNKIWIPVFLLAVVMAGCSDADTTAGAGNPGGALNPPTVLSALPGPSGICPNAVATVLFSKMMNPMTIVSPATTFTLTTGGVNVPGTVKLDPTGTTATFTPTAPLALNTTFIATITTGAKDLFGNGLAMNFTFTFMTAAMTCSSPVPLGTAGNFKVLASSTVTNTLSPPGTTITGGNLGLSPGTAVTGFPPGTLTPPAVMHVADAVAATAQNDLTTAFNFAMNLPSNFPLPANLGGVILTVPGVYTAASSTMIPVGGTFTLNGTATDVYVFQIGSIPSTLTTGTNSVVMLTGGLLPSNVFWQVGSSATLGVNSVFVGTIMAQASITLDTGATLQGRALARTGAVTLDNNTIFDP